MFVKKAELEAIKFRIKDLENQVRMQERIHDNAFGKKEPYEIKVTTVCKKGRAHPQGIGVSDVSFVLNYDDWCQLKKLDAWKEVETFLEAVRSEYTQDIIQ